MSNHVFTIPHSLKSHVHWVINNRTIAMVIQYKFQTRINANIILENQVWFIGNDIFEIYAYVETETILRRLYGNK